MAAPTTTDTELLTEHFGFSPVSLLDDIINSINTLASKAINSIESGLLNVPPSSLGFRAPTNPKTQPPYDPSTAHHHEITSGTHQLETLLFASIDKNFDLFEIYTMRNILCIRPADRSYLRLSHYEGLDFLPAAASPDLESVTRLRRRLQASQKLNTMLRAERARNAALLEALRGLVVPGGVKQEGEEGTGAPFAFVQRASKVLAAESGGEMPVATTTAFTLSQLEALRSLSGSLGRIGGDLKGVSGEEDGGGRRSWRRERLEYVETAARKHLERVRGLDLGEAGEVDGEGEGGGGRRGLGTGEVEGLEGVVASLGGRTETGE